MFYYKQPVIVSDGGFYNNVPCIVLDKRIYNNEIQYLVNLDPPRWLSARKLQPVTHTLPTSTDME